MGSSKKTVEDSTPKTAKIESKAAAAKDIIKVYAAVKILF
jgi:hypothetical protein